MPDPCSARVDVGKQPEPVFVRGVVPEPAFGKAALQSDMPIRVKRDTKWSPQSNMQFLTGPGASDSAGSQPLQPSTCRTLAPEPPRFSRVCLSPSSGLDPLGSPNKGMPNLKSCASEAKQELPFQGVPIHKLLFVEICAGSARLSKAAKKQGFSVMPVDNSRARAHGVHICIFDLTEPHQFQCLMDALRVHKGQIIMVFIAPPCGTSSRARERPIKGVHDAPKQLRSELFPDGLPYLQHEDKRKTEAANLVYEAVANIVAWCSEEAIPVIVENPLRSYMWLTSAFRKVNRMLPEETLFENCVRGSSRDKWTLLKGFNHFSGTSGAAL